MSRADAHGISKRKALWIGAVLALVAALAAITPAVFAATETPGFCTSCHEMRPYHTAWAQGVHKDISCVSCHVDPGTVNHVTHKVTALKEVWMHFMGTPRFPGAVGSIDVPNERCLACHKNIPTANPTSGFSHVKHAKSEPKCTTCHTDPGHKVTSKALAAEGILSSSSATKTAGWTGGVATALAESASTTSTPVHIEVSCTSCHNLVTTPCATCHTPKHQPRGTCTTCHAPGAAWVFTHPVRTDCTTCHTAPKPHFPGQCSTCHARGTSFKLASFTHTSSSTACATCHARPAGHRSGQCSTCHAAGTTWTFKHPAAAGANCASCHARPAGHRSGQCSTCHAAGTTWAFHHPQARANCASCHSAPSGHFAATCSTCHTPSVPFKNATFRHPSAGARCQSCHRPPSGHSTSSCATCHKHPGVSWAASHPSSRACASCHRPPANHFGSTCSSCHSPGVAFRNAHFSHPKVPGGEHTYRSWPCLSCHPHGYSTVDCTTCHATRRD